MGFEPMMRVLQTLALPLGHVALQDNILIDFGCFGKENKIFWRLDFRAPGAPENSLEN